MPSLRTVVFALTLAASSAHAEDDDCTSASRKLAATAGTCLGVSDPGDACVQQALSAWSKATRKLQCDNAGKALHGCLKACTGDKKFACMNTCMSSIVPGGTAAPVGETTAPIAPPPPREEDSTPRAGFVFVAGHWYMREGRWEWGSGRYERARAGQAWLNGAWERRGDKYQWVEGRWLKTSED